MRASSLCLVLLICFFSTSSAIPPDRARSLPAGPKWEVAYDFVEALSSGGAVENPNSASSVTAAPGGVTKAALFQHPDAPGRPLVTLTFPRVPVPRVKGRERPLLRFWTAIREGFSRTNSPEADGVGFLVEIDGREVFRRTQVEQQWREAGVDLSRYAGRAIRVAFQTDPLRTSAYDWALWGVPQVVIEGRRAKVKEIARVPYLALPALLQEPVVSRIVERRDEGYATTLVTVLDRHLDLAAQVKDFAATAGAPLVPLAPALVVGEGEDPQNHTVVKVLNRWGIADVQFTAYSPEVRGGVRVRAGTFAPGGLRIVAAPLADARTPEIRLFDRWGGPSGAFVPGQGITPPYVIAVGDFLPDHPGDEIAVASRRAERGSRAIGLFGADGARLASHVIEDAPAGELALSTQRARPADRLAAYLPGAKRAFVYDAAARTVEKRDLPFLESETGLYASAFDPTILLATGPEERTSTLTRIGRDAAPARLDAGAAESRFWLQWYAPGWSDLPDGKYVRKSVFRHLRTDGASPAARNPALALNPAQVAGEAFLRGFQSLFTGYDRDIPALWEPCFTHRQMKGVFAAWRAATDPATGHAKYMMLTRKNRPVEYGEFGDVGFNASTYAFGLPALDNLYVLPLRAFLRRLAVPFRRNPEHMAGLEPNHEHEIAVEADGSMGDYNPRMIQGFYHYLTALYGRDLKGLNAALGTAFKTHFDAPRNEERGAWDSYSPANPFYREWIAYNRYVVNRRLAQTYREALLAGFPPEIIKSHQIPDTYAVGNLQAFSDVTARFTPIDYALNAGVGYGFTRYGVWYNRPHDALQDAHAAGFDLMSLGEYQALTPNNTAAYEQLRYIQEHGGSSVHCMLWPEGHDRGFNASMDYAARRLMAEDAPKPGIPGGVGEVRAFVDGERRFDIACIGTGPERTGLLKSLNADGTWEGSVYVVPFHAHVTLEPVLATGSVRGGRGRLACGPLAGLDSGSQVEVTFRARASRPGALLFRAFRNGRALPGMQAELAVGTGWRSYRCILRAQLPAEGIHLDLAPRGAKSGITVEEARVLRHTEQTPKLARGQFQGRRHRGGVTFDVLDAPKN